MKRTLFSVVVLVGLVAVAAVAAQDTPRWAIDYDTFWTMDLQGRLRAFNEATPENRAALVREHLTRWMDANRARLSTEQLKVLGENLAAITPDFYRVPQRPEVMERAKALEAKTAAVMSRDDIGASMTLYGAYIQKKK